MNAWRASAAAAVPQPDQLPLSGLKVIDLTLARAGPACVRHLADWGADVIRVDRPAPLAGTPEYEDVTGSQHNSDYQNLHRNKRSIRIDLKHPQGKELLLDLLRDADVVVENMRPQVKKRLGIAYEDVREINPRLVYGSISGFGQDGPYCERPGLDQIAQGMTGVMSVTGLASTGPMRTGIAVGDMSAGNMLALNIMMALYERQRTGLGRWVHTSLLESLLFMTDFQATSWLVDGRVPSTVGNEHPTAVPSGAFATSDGFVSIAAPSSRMWPKLCVALGQPQWAQKAEWETRELRRVHRQAVHESIAEVTRTQSTAHWIELLNAAGVTCGPIYSMDQVFEDEQVRHLGMSAPVEHPHLGRLHLLSSPLNFEGTRRELRSATPDAGAHTDEILRELGYPPDKIKALRASLIC